MQDMALAMQFRIITPETDTHSAELPLEAEPLNLSVTKKKLAQLNVPQLTKLAEKQYTYTYTYIYIYIYIYIYVYRESSGYTGLDFRGYERAPIKNIKNNMTRHSVLRGLAS